MLDEACACGGFTVETTNLWRQGPSCPFGSTEHAVIEMLGFLGVDHVVYLPPTEKDLEPRYSKRGRGTFLAIR